jgi:protein-tyrosine-phosphatase
MLNVLFLDTGNTFHSVIAESILRVSGRGRFHAHSAGCLSAGTISPDVLGFLRERDLPVECLRSKGLRELATPESPPLAFVITLSDLAASAANERTFSGDPVIVHWNLDDDDDAEESPPSIWAIRDGFWILSRRLRTFTSLPHGTASRQLMVKRLQSLQGWQ